MGTFWGYPGLHP